MRRRAQREWKSADELTDVSIREQYKQRSSCRQHRTQANRATWQKSDKTCRTGRQQRHRRWLTYDQPARSHDSEGYWWYDTRLGVWIMQIYNIKFRQEHEQGRRGWTSGQRSPISWQIETDRYRDRKTDRQEEKERKFRKKGNNSNYTGKRP